MKSKTFLKFMFAIIAILIIGDFTSSCSSDEYEGLQLSFATRKKTRSGELGSDTSNKTWIAEAVENDIWTIEVCPNCTLDILYGWDRTEFLPEDRCKVNGRATMSFNSPTSIVLNNDTLLRNITMITGFVDNPLKMGWKDRVPQGGNLYVNCSFDLHCTVACTSLMVDSLGKEINTRELKDTIITIENFYKEKYISVSMHEEEID